jgi:hypothetical protein
MNEKPDDTWAIELLDGLIPELNRRTNEANERIRAFELYLRKNGLCVPAMATTRGMFPGSVVFMKTEDGEWRVRWLGGDDDPNSLVPLLECPRYVKLTAMTGWDAFVATVVQSAAKYAKGEVGR